MTINEEIEVPSKDSPLSLRFESNGLRDYDESSSANSSVSPQFSDDDTDPILDTKMTIKGN